MKLKVINRSCGECTACCTVMGVPELGKPYYQTCKRLDENGCSKYEKRPHSCRIWTCIYLDGVTDHRPDLSGVLCNPVKERLLPVYETRAGAWEEPTAKQEAIRTFDRYGCFDGIILYRFGGFVPMGYKPQTCYEDRGEYNVTIPATVTHEIDGIKIFEAAQTE